MLRGVCGVRPALLLGRLVVVVVARELGPVRDVILEHDLLWVGGARQELFAWTDLLEDLLSLRRKRYISLTCGQSIRDNVCEEIL